MTQRDPLFLDDGTGHQGFDALAPDDIPDLSADYDAAGAAAAAQDASQPLNANLTAVGGLTSAANKGIQYTGSGTAATYDLTAAAKTVLDDTTVGAMVDTLGGAASTGTGGLVRTTSPTFITPVLGTPTSGVATNLTGTAAGLTAGTVTTNANLTGDVTSSGNATTLVTVTIAKGGTNATTAATARTNLDLGKVVPQKPPFRTGASLWYGSWEGGFSTLVLVQSTQYATPFYVPETITCTGIGVIATGVASSSVNLSIYNDNAGVPDTLVLDAGNATTTTTAFASKTSLSQSLTRGWYWLACAVQGAAGSVFCNTSSFLATTRLPLSAPFSNAMNGGYATTGVTGAAPSPWGATKTETARVPMVFLQF